MPFYQSALGDRLEYELTFNDYSCAIRATDDANASYDIENISLEYEIVTQPELARMIANQYNSRLAILYDPGERLQDYLRAFYLVFKGEPTLFIIDGCSATKALTKKRDMLSELAFSGPHPEIQLSPDGLARADSLGRTLPLQGSRQL